MPDSETLKPEAAAAEAEVKAPQPEKKGDPFERLNDIVRTTLDTTSQRVGEAAKAGTQRIESGVPAVGGGPEAVAALQAEVAPVQEALHTVAADEAAALESVASAAQESSPADKAFDTMKTESADRAAEARSQISVDGKRVAIDAVTPEAAKGLDLTERTLKNADLLLEKGLLSPKELGAKLPQGLECLTLLGSMPLKAVEALMQQGGPEFNLKVEESVKELGEGLVAQRSDIVRMEASLIMMAVRVPGAGRMLKDAGYAPKFVEAAGRFKERVAEDPGREVRKLIGENGLGALLEGGSRLGIKKEQAVSMLKEAAASKTMDQMSFKTLALQVLELQRTGALSEEEVGQIVQGSTNYAQFMQ